MHHDFHPELKTEVPGPKSREYSTRLKKCEVPTVTHFSKDTPIFWKRAEGIHVWDVDDNRYIDLTSAFGVASLGHSDSDVQFAIQNQSKFLSHAMGDVYPALQKLELCEKLSEITFEKWTGGKIHGQSFLCNSGFEAIEAALKTARLFTGKRGIIAFEDAYHGLGYGALETTWRKDFRQPFLDQLGHFTEFVRFPRETGNAEQNQAQLDSIERHIQAICSNSEIGAILVEPIQGRGGEVIPPNEFLPLLRKICDKKRILLIVDEIYVGFWRTGKWFAIEHTETVPDLICLGKSLTGSLPLSACIGKETIMAAWPESRGEALHTSTFSGNPIACAAALASIWKFHIEAPQWNVEVKGRTFLNALKDKLSARYGIKEIRGIGFLIGIEFDTSASHLPPTLSTELLKKGIITLPSGSKGEVLAINPPLPTDMNVLNWCADQIELTLKTLSAK